MSSASLSSHWNKIQRNLFPGLNESLGPLSDKQMQLVNAVEMIRFEQFIKAQPRGPGRPAIDRISMAIAFLAKSIYQLSTTEMLIDRLKADIVLRLALDVKPGLADDADDAGHVLEEIDGAFHDARRFDEGLGADDVGTDDVFGVKERGFAAYGEIGRAHV